MIKEITATGKTVNEAVEALKQKLSVTDLDGIDYKVLSVGKKGGLFGIGAAPAKVAAYINDGQTESAPVSEQSKSKAFEKSASEDSSKELLREQPAQRPMKTERPSRPERGSADKSKSRAAEPAEKTADMKPKRPKSPITETETAAAVRFVETLIQNLEIQVKAELVSDEGSGARISITGADAGMLIGHHGETLDALQYLANLAANRAEGKGDHERIAVDVENYRQKREETLRALARRMAAKVQKYGRSVVLEPMNPYERRIIHAEVQEIEGVSTSSIGSDSNRKVVLFPTDQGMGKLPVRTDKRRSDAQRRGRGTAPKRSHDAAAAPEPAQDEQASENE